ncbi:nucleoid-associated protein [Rheinheimera maricola]|uniref:Nucleoid-associated protein n=1 Tax=Rheinheimera maricola TaxID=2793282 RepID=A0ABS7X9D0_9GAMM|nr:nucleoid-associated protein [Rheinheimera maricola]MBZ9612159.1 nucleoid-associated protein [Rheinheimera maricola]
MDQYKFEGLTIERLIAHTIFARGKDKALVPPNLTNELIPLSGDAKDLIQLRVTAALGSSSHGLEVQVVKSDTNSFMQRAAASIHASDDDFKHFSKEIAKSLADAQTNPKWPGGVLIIFNGKVGESQQPFLAALKAETDKGFDVEEVNGKITLKLIKKMLLSQTQRLYKIGILIENQYQKPVDGGGFLPANYRAFLFDHLLTATETKPAAAYFYDTFLGMSITGSSKFQTRLFYEETKLYIDAMPIDDGDKYDLREALRSELRSQNATIQLKEFADTHFEPEHRADYIKTMLEKGVPDSAVVKDVEYIKAKLRRPRNFMFSSGVKIQAPADASLNELVIIGQQSDGYTTVQIKGGVQTRE